MKTSSLPPTSWAWPWSSPASATSAIDSTLDDQSMTPAVQLSRHLGTRIGSLAGQMDWLRGLRAAVALCTPLMVGFVTGHNLGWAALGGFEAILADTGGPYRTRLSSLATLSFGGAAGLFLGCIAGKNLHWALPV